MAKDKGQKPTKPGLGFGNGSMIDYHDGTIGYREFGKVHDAFQVRVSDITGFGIERHPRESSMRQFSVFGHGTTLATAAITYGKAGDKIQEWIRQHPDFRGGGHDQAAASPFVADELMKLTHLRDTGVLTDDEFTAQKARLPGTA